MTALVVNHVVRSVRRLPFVPCPDAIALGLDRGQPRFLIESTLGFLAAAGHVASVFGANTLSTGSVCKGPHQLHEI